METSDYELISKMADQAHDKASDRRAKHLKAKGLADWHTKTGNIKQANKCTEVAAGYLNDYFYWIGHHNAYKGIAAGLALRETERRNV